MNRSTFFKTLFAGLLSAPAVTKVIKETEQSPFTFRKVSEYRPATFAERRTLGYRVYKHGVWWAPDQRPLRFEMRPSDYVGNGKHKINLQTGEIT